MRWLICFVSCVLFVDCCLLLVGCGCLRFVVCDLSRVLCSSLFVIVVSWLVFVNRGCSLFGLGCW